MNENIRHCDAHSGFCIRLKHLEKIQTEQASKIRDMEKMGSKILISTIFILIGVIANLVLLYVKL